MSTDRMRANIELLSCQEIKINYCEKCNSASNLQRCPICLNRDVKPIIFYKHQ